MAPEEDKIRVYEAAFNYVTKGLKDHNPKAVYCVAKYLRHNIKGLRTRVEKREGATDESTIALSTEHSPQDVPHSS